MEASRHHKVLIVDDDPAILHLCGRSLRSASVSVAMARSVKEARAMLAETNFDLLITDYQMPELTGFDLVLWLRNSGNLTPVILMSGTLSACKVFERAGITHWEFLGKPFHPLRFQTLVLELMCNATPPHAGKETEI
jgi:DNA-binding NtrC family response regulator